MMIFLQVLKGHSILYCLSGWCWHVAVILWVMWRIAYLVAMKKSTKKHGLEKVHAKSKFPWVFWSSMGNFDAIEHPPKKPSMEIKNPRISTIHGATERTLKKFTKIQSPKIIESKNWFQWILNYNGKSKSNRANPQNSHGIVKMIWNRKKWFSSVNYAVKHSVIILSSTSS